MSRGNQRGGLGSGNGHVVGGVGRVWPACTEEGDPDGAQRRRASVSEAGEGERAPTCGPL
jgi:hypothetical protein